MDSSNALPAAHYSDDDVIAIVMRNILIMLSNRKRFVLTNREAKTYTGYHLIDGEAVLDDWDNQRGRLVKVTGETTYTIATKLTSNKVPVLFAVKILLQSINSLSNQPAIVDFFAEYSGMKKLLVVNDYKPGLTGKASDEKTELFRTRHFFQDILTHVLQPKWILLDPTEQEQVMTEYLADQAEMPKMLISDPIARYFHLPIDTVIRIHRPSRATGVAVSYRIVVNKP